MIYPRQLPLFEGGMKQGTWSERMECLEYAVHYSSFEETVASGPYCTILGSLNEAEAFATAEVARRPALRCTIYDHHGLIGAPLRDIRGSKFKAESEISPRFRRWGGSVLFLGGLILIMVDWLHDFRFSWPAMIGVRMLILGSILLVTEAMVVLHKRLDRRRMAGTERA
jgi:hypothetical protein